MSDAIIKRSFDVSDFTTTEESGKIEGHAAVFLQRGNVGCRPDTGFFEIINPGAFDGCDLSDVFLFVNHNTNRIPIARSQKNNKNSTMQLSVDDKGLFITADLDIENNSEARSLHSAVLRGDISGMSFLFAVKDEHWEDLDSKKPTRYIDKIAKVYEVSAVNIPVYTDTDIFARGNISNELDALEKIKEEHNNSKMVSIAVNRLKIQILSEV